MFVDLGIRCFTMKKMGWANGMDLPIPLGNRVRVDDKLCN